MKKISTILLLTLFVYNTVGFLAIHPFLSMYYKYLGMMRADMPSEAEMIELLVFNKEDIEKGSLDFKWIHSHEFTYNGDMYDIVQKKETDKQLIVYVINDTKEKKLEEDFEKRVHKNSSEDTNRPTENNINVNSISEPVCSEELYQAVDFKHNFYCIYISLYKSFLPDIPSPPPKSNS